MLIAPGSIGLDDVLARQAAGLIYGVRADDPSVTISQASYLVAPSLDRSAMWYVPRVVNVRKSVAANREHDWSRNLDDNFNRAADRIRLDYALRKRLGAADQIVELEIPLLKEDGSVRLIKGGRSLFNNILGPGQGGTRFVNGLALEDLWCLSNDMVWKLAVHGCAAGGAKGGLDFDPTTVNPYQARIVAEAFASMLAPYLGPDTDAMGPDMNTGNLMGAMGHAFAHYHGLWEPSIVTGKSMEAGALAAYGGTAGRPESTGYGVASAIEAAYAIENMKLAGSTVVVQGAGQVGFFAAEKLASKGALIVGMGDETGNIFDPQGIDLTKLAAWLKGNGGKVQGYPHAVSRSQGADALLTSECDILIPAAVQKQIHRDNAGRIRALVVAEGANSPTTAEADQILERKGVLILPDILANGRGVATSLMERQQNRTGVALRKEQVETLNHQAQVENVRRFLIARQQYNTDARVAAMISALLFLQEKWSELSI